MTLRMLMLLWIALSALGLAASAWMVVRDWAGAARQPSFAGQTRAPG